MFIFVISVIFLVYLFELFLGIKNYLQKDVPLPNNVKDIYDEAAYSNWRKYSAEVFRFGLIVDAVQFVILLGLLVLGGFAYLFDLASSFTENSLLQTLIFLGIYYGVMMIIAIPFKYYAQFSIEERYGFNKMTKKVFISDTLKGFIVGAIFGGGIMALLHTVYITFEDSIILFVGVSWVVLMTIILVMSYLYTRVFIKIFNKLSPIEEGSLKEKINELAERVGYKIRGIYTMDASKRSTKLNAFFSGFGKNKEVVLFDTLIEKLSEEEVLAVLAHELGHAVHKDVTKLMVGQAIMFAVYAALIAVVLSSDALAIAFGLKEATFGFSIILFMILITPVNIVLGLPIHYVSRKFEYKADAFSAKYVDSAIMISALKVLVNENYADLNPHPLYEFIYYTHPAPSKRLQALSNLT